jgi:predicted RNA binding protein YcfA (HicA-like mRNA interferase family)
LPSLPGINHLAAIRAFEKAGFRVERQGKHVTMSDGVRIVTIPRHNPIHSFTMAGIVKDAGLSIEEFKKLL